MSGGKTTRGKKRILYLFLIMTVVSFTLVGLSTSFLYNISLKEEKERLVVTAKSQARLIESVARFDAKYSENLPDGSRKATLSQVEDAHSHYQGFGDTGEFTLAYLDQGNINFLLSHRHDDLDHPRPVPIDSDFAEPMRRALSGKSGTVVGLDYRGQTVIAAYEPVKELNLGIVAKIDLSEIQEPFKETILIVLSLSVLVILGGAGLFYRISNPIIEHLASHAEELSAANNNLKQEINQRKKAEDELKESEQRFRILFEQAAVGVAQIVTKTGQFVRINQKYCNIVGYTVEEMTTSTFMEITHPDDLSADLNNMKKLTDNQIHEFSMEKRYIHKSGEIVWVNLTVSSMWNIGDDPDYHIAVVEDITTRKQAENALTEFLDGLEQQVKTRTKELADTNRKLKSEIEQRKESERKIRRSRQTLQTVFDGISDPLLMIDEDMSVIMLNDATKKYYQTDGEKELIGKVCYEATFGRTSPCNECPVPEHLLNGTRHSYIRKGLFDSHLAENVMIFPVENDRSGKNASILYITDVTETMEMNRQMARADRLSSLGQLSGGIAHEIRNPLSGISLFVDVLCDEEKFKRTESELEIFEDIRSAIKKIDGIIKRILSFARDTKVEASEMDVNSLIKDTISLWQVAMRNQLINLELSLAEDLPKVVGDAIGIQQVTNNLVQNAADAMEKGGKLRISTCTKNSDFHKGRQVLSIQIEDTGKGISAIDQEKIFNPFFTTKATGTGLGLSISSQIIERQGGFMTFASRPGHGTSFTIELPIA
jgi:PAS domain S-box-containing protein